MKKLAVAVPRTDSEEALEMSVHALVEAGWITAEDDLRRAATQESIGKGLRVTVASTADLARILAALGREADMPTLIALRRLQTLEHTVGHELAPLT